MNLRDAIQHGRARIREIDDRLAAIQTELTTLQNEKQQLRSDLADMQAYLDAKAQT